VVTETMRRKLVRTDLDLPRLNHRGKTRRAVDLSDVAAVTTKLITQLVAIKQPS
jgi:hypothetical protein